jgi:sulfite reductase (NADPH) flavoprotein alpha-component
LIPGNPDVTERRVRVLYASETGNSEQLASDLVDALAEHEMSSEPERLNDVSMDDLGDGSTYLVIIPTTGEGNMPYDAEKFWARLSDEAAPRVEGLEYAVLALGDTGYLDFCQAGIDIDARLEELGGARLLPVAKADVDLEPAAHGWITAITDRLSGAEPEPTDAPVEAVAETDEPEPVVRAPKATDSAHVAARERLTAEAALRDVWSVQLDISGSGVAYEPGDSVDIVPTNDPEAVEALIEALHASEADDADGSPLGERLLTDVELVKPSKELVTEVARRTSDAWVREILSGEDRRGFAAFLWARDIVDLVQLADAEPFTTADLLPLLRPIAARSYSISSSPLVDPARLELTIAALRYEVGSRRRVGVSSTYLADRRQTGDEIRLSLEANPRFRLPDDDVPIIMVGPGTGIAPFRAFLQHRRARGATGRNWLFFGARNRASDFLYEDDLLGWQKDGLLTRLDLAFSRDTADRVYVQNRMRAAGAELFDWLEQGATFYVCGDAANMARDVDSALTEIIAEHGALSPHGASEYVDRLSRERRYLRDVY